MIASLKLEAKHTWHRTWPSYYDLDAARHATKAIQSSGQHAAAQFHRRHREHHMWESAAASTASTDDDPWLKEDPWQGGKYTAPASESTPACDAWAAWNFGKVECQKQGGHTLCDNSVVVRVELLEKIVAELRNTPSLDRRPESEGRVDAAAPSPSVSGNGDTASISFLPYYQQNFLALGRAHMQRLYRSFPSGMVSGSESQLHLGDDVDNRRAVGDTLLSCPRGCGLLRPRQGDGQGKCDFCLREFDGRQGFQACVACERWSCARCTKRFLADHHCDKDPGELKACD